MYNVNIDLYYQLLHKAITKKRHKIVNENDLRANNLNAKMIMSGYKIKDVTEIYQLYKHGITLKDHKSNFHSDPKVWLICPYKLDIGKLSKFVLDKYIFILKIKIKLHLWLDTIDAIKWLNFLNDKRKYNFIQLDIDCSYQSISHIPLNHALIFAKNRTNLSMNEIKVILEARKTIIYHNGSCFGTRMDNLIVSIFHCDLRLG